MTHDCTLSAYQVFLKGVARRGQLYFDKYPRPSKLLHGNTQPLAGSGSSFQSWDWPTETFILITRYSTIEGVSPGSCFKLFSLPLLAEAASGQPTVVVQLSSATGTSTSSSCRRTTGLGACGRGCDSVVVRRSGAKRNLAEPPSLQFSSFQALALL